MCITPSPLEEAFLRYNMGLSLEPPLNQEVLLSLESDELEDGQEADKNDAELSLDDNSSVSTMNQASSAFVSTTSSFETWYEDDRLSNPKTGSPT